MKRWYFSHHAIEAHVLCLGGIAVLTFAYFDGDKIRPREQFLYVIIFLALAYLALLGLIWWLSREEEIEKIKEILPPPDIRIRKRKQGRIAGVIFVTLGG